MEYNEEREKLSFWKKIISSIQGIKHYENVLKDPVGKSILYLLLISLLLGTIGAIRVSIEVNNGISRFISIYNAKCPNFEIKNGELSVDGNMPIVLSKDDYNYIVIDTTNKTSPSILDSHSEGILILKDKIIQKKNKVQTQVIDIKSLQGLYIDKTIVNTYLYFVKAIIPFIFIGNIFGYFLGGLLSSLFLALFALIINGIFETKLKYGQLYSLSIYALTTPLIISTLFEILNLKHFSFYWLVYHIIAYVYIGFALNKLKNSSNNIVANY
ncbi:DUF1189 domain-containing protein [Clostridium sp.]|uniref:DUF1189 domain-containing protein n=1 Tax=Clostridium sp. TaxID=1506 RepID=UPI002628D2DF|nr:DUF1189 domain-containing protein [Clostridium sp.]